MRENFNPRSPRGERPVAALNVRILSRFQSTLPARGATLEDGYSQAGDWISIHAPREGSDCRHIQCRDCNSNFNPRSPRGERPLTLAVYRPAWTISIHAPREGSDQLIMETLSETYDISIHAPREGSDSWRCTTCADARKFQSTLPARGATGSDVSDLDAGQNFNPRSPRGERPDDFYESETEELFQSTLPARGATGWLTRDRGTEDISIHAPREGSDRQSAWGRGRV